MAIQLSDQKVNISIITVQSLPSGGSLKKIFTGGILGNGNDLSDLRFC
jgi:hypothetical protein